VVPAVAGNRISLKVSVGDARLILRATA